MLAAGRSVRSGVLQLPARGTCLSVFNRKSLTPGHTCRSPPSAGCSAVCCHTLAVAAPSGSGMLSSQEKASGDRTPSGVRMGPGRQALFGTRGALSLGTPSCLGMPLAFKMAPDLRIASGVRTLSGIRIVAGLGTIPGVRRFSGGTGWYSSLSDSAPVHLCEHLLVSMQQGSGLPWWLSIMLSTLTVRTIITLPLAAYQMIIIAKVEALQAEISELAKRLRYEVSVRAREKGWTEKQSRFQFRKNLRRIVSQLYVRDNCHPFKAGLLVWVQLPLWISLSLALRNLSVDQSALQSDLAAGGALWFPDLTSPDSTWILPVCLGLTNLLIIEVFSAQKVDPSRLQRLVRSSIRVLAVLMVPIAATVPSAVALYWFTSSLVGLSHNLLLRSAAVHKVLHLPTPRSDTPYRDLLSAVSAKYCRR